MITFINISDGWDGYMNSMGDPGGPFIIETLLGKNVSYKDIWNERILRSM